MKLIVISGAKYSKKNLLAFRLSNKPNCVWIKPYTNKRDPINAEPHDKYIPLNDNQLMEKMDREVALASTILNGYLFVFFENQLKDDYSIIVGDDKIVHNTKSNWDGDIVTVKCHSPSEEPSSRFLFKDSEFDISTKISYRRRMFNNRI